MAVSLLHRLAAGARVAFFPLVGDGAQARIRRLRLDSRLRLVSSPRHANLLLVAGELPSSALHAASQVHDQLPPPRATVVWGGRPAHALPFPDIHAVAEKDDPAPVLLRLHRELLTGERPSAPTILPNENPVPWKGIGPHGQGGKGMMGGKPYGRSMAMTAEDVRDGLMLDRLPLTVGPFLPWIPGGLRLELALQGDVVQELRFRVPPLTHHDLPEVFVRAEHEQVLVSELELARARHHLEAVADLLLLHGLDALAERTLRLALEVAPEAAGAVRSLELGLRRTGALWLATRGVGVLAGEQVAGMGPVARACGLREDARTEDPAYAGLGFAPVTHEGGDAEARWRQRLDEAVQSLELAGRASERLRTPGTVLERPRGREGAADTALLLELLAELAVGQAWDELVTTLVSLDLDPAAAPAGDYGRPAGERDGGGRHGEHREHEGPGADGAGEHAARGGRRGHGEAGGEHSGEHSAEDHAGHSAEDHAGDTAEHDAGDTAEHDAGDSAEHRVEHGGQGRHDRGEAA